MLIDKTYPTLIIKAGVKFKSATAIVCLVLVAQWDMCGQPLIVKWQP